MYLTSKYDKYLCPLIILKLFSLVRKSTRKVVNFFLEWKGFFFSLFVKICDFFVFFSSSVARERREGTHASFKRKERGQQVLLREKVLFFFSSVRKKVSVSLTHIQTKKPFFFQVLFPNCFGFSFVRVARLFRACLYPNFFFSLSQAYFWFVFFLFENY